MGVVLESRSGPMFPLLATNDTTTGTSIADPADTTTNPATSNSGDVATGVIRWGDGGAVCPPSLKIVPFGTDTSAQTFLMSVFAIERIIPGVKGAAGIVDAWTYHLLAAFTCTLCTKTGVAKSAVNASQLYCGTIALNTGNAGVSVEVVSPTGNQAGHVLVDCKGTELVKILFARNSSAASMNALVGRL